MKRIFISLLTCAAIFGAAPAYSQFYEIANQIPQLISPALSGSANYKGFVEASYLKGVGSQNADFAEISTSQGFQFTNWFYMGVGAGVSMIMTNPDSDWNESNFWQGSYRPDKSMTSTGVIVPLFTDFRFNIGSKEKVSFFADLRLGCSFLISNSYIKINQGYLTSSQNFYMRPSIGVRIPINQQNAKQAVNIGLDYQLITSNYWYNYNSNVCLNSLGVNVSYEW